MSGRMWVAGGVRAERMLSGLIRLDCRRSGLVAVAEPDGSFRHGVESVWSGWVRAGGACSGDCDTVTAYGAEWCSEHRCWSRGDFAEMLRADDAATVARLGGAA